MGAFADRYGPWAVVAGASEGLGAAFASALAARGLHLVLLARREPVLRLVAEGLAARHGVEVRPVVRDLGEPALGDALRAATAGLDVGLAVYDAAASLQGPHLSHPVGDLLRIVDVNVRGPVELVHALAPAMVARGRGGVVLMSSVVGLQGSPGLAGYAASKAFTTVLGQSLWAELGPHGVDVLVAVAGAIRTPNYLKAARTIAPGTLDADDVAERVLARLGRGPVTVPGALNRIAAFLLGPVLPRRAALALVGRSTADALKEHPS